MKTNVTLRVDKNLVLELRKKKINLSMFFEYCMQTMVLKKDVYLVLQKDKNGKLEYIKKEIGGMKE